jgi:hypothetical protein
MNMRWNRPWLAKQPFVCLARHFFARFFDSELVSGDGDGSMGVGGILAILAVPGLLCPVFLFAKYSSFLAWLHGHPKLNVWYLSLSDQYLLIAYAMTVIGIAAVIKWDSLFPDRRDFAALAPLPLTAARIFSAKVIALAALLLVFIVDVNGPSALVFPMTFLAGWGTFGDYVHFTAIHLLTILAASCFTFFFFMAVAGAFLVALPPRWFARVSRYVRAAAVIALLAMLLTGFAVSDSVMRGHYGGVIRLLPPVWFLSFSRMLFGQPAYPVFAKLGMVAVWALLGAGGFAMAAYALSYRRYFVKIPESIDAPAGRYSRVSTFVYRSLQRALPGTPFERASSVFALQTIFRSEKHWLMLGAYAGLGLAIAAETLAGTLKDASSVPPTPVLAVPLILIFFLLSGLRFIFALPSELQANWVFQICGDAPCEAGVRIAKNVMLTMALPILAVSLAAYVIFYSAAIALAHIAFVAMLSMIFADVMLSGYRSVPFTCSWAPGKRNPAFSVAVYAAAFFIFASMMSSMEHWMLGGVARYAVIITLMAVAWRYWKHETVNGIDPGAPLRFEDRREPAVQTLNLS